MDVVTSESSSFKQLDLVASLGWIHNRQSGNNCRVFSLNIARRVTLKGYDANTHLLYFMLRIYANPSVPTWSYCKIADADYNRTYGGALTSPCRKTHNISNCFANLCKWCQAVSVCQFLGLYSLCKHVSETICAEHITNSGLEWQIGVLP